MKRLFVVVHVVVHVVVVNVVVRPDRSRSSRRDIRRRRSERTKAASSKTEATPRGRRRSREDASPREFPHCD